MNVAPTVARFVWLPAPPRGPLRLRSGEASPAAPAGDDVASSFVEITPPRLSLHILRCPPRARFAYLQPEFKCLLRKIK